MKKILFVIISIVFLLGLGVPAKAQMQPKYSTVHNWSVTWDSNNNPTIVSQVITQGYTVCGQCSPQWQHQARATQQWTGGIGSSGGIHYGPWQCVTCNLYAESDGVLTLNGNDIGNLINEDDQGQVQCSVAGTFFYSYFNIEFEIAFTRFKTTGYIPKPDDVPPHRYYSITPFCTPDTTPPDWTGAGSYWVTPEPPPYPTDITDGKTICARYVSGGYASSWVCPPVGRFVGSYALGYPAAFCTKTP